MHQLDINQGGPSPERIGRSRFVETILSWFSGKRIFIDEKPYLTRYYLVGDGSGTSTEIYLHHIQAIDHFRWLHNHPWPWFLSIVLRGTYTQDVAIPGIRPSETVNVRWLNFFRGQDRYHAIRSLPSGDAWSLVVVPKKNDHVWGYWDTREQRHVPDDSLINQSSRTVLFGSKKIVD